MSGRPVHLMDTGPLVHHGAHRRLVVHNAGRWCTTQSCTHQVVHNIGLTNPCRQTDRHNNNTEDNTYLADGNQGDTNIGKPGDQIANQKIPLLNKFIPTYTNNQPNDIHLSSHTGLNNRQFVSSKDPHVLLSATLKNP